MLVYLLVNKINGKMYVGQTSRSLGARLSEHKNHKDKKNYVIAAAIKKYGMDSFESSVLATAESQEHLNRLERLWIALLRTWDRNFGYNVAGGGRYNFHNEETRRKISETMKRKGIKPAEHIRMAGNAANRGRKRSPEVIALFRKLKLGKTSPKKGKSFPHLRGKTVHTAESKRQIGDAHRGEKCNFFGKVPWNKKH